MSFADVCRNVASGLGKFVGASHNVLVRVGKAPRNALRRSEGKLRSMSTKEKVQSIVIEELMRLVSREAELTRAKLEERLQIMAETILALQERINELSPHGLIGEADMREAVDSLKAAESLNDDERAVLVRIFRQNVTLQKPELVGAAN
ncbi:MAG: hypothetical protein ACYTBX_01130 [Planctomycetota bacterium]|jgi:hypothetical protein